MRDAMSSLSGKVVVIIGGTSGLGLSAAHAYAAAKSAVIGFTKSCAAYYAPQNIRFNVIAPGLIETPMSRRAAGDDTVQKFIGTKQPLDGARIGAPADLDAAVVYLVSD